MGAEVVEVATVHPTGCIIRMGTTGTMDLPWDPRDTNANAREVSSPTLSHLFAA